MLASIYRCPICHLSLQRQHKTFKCDNNHCFDVAKEGYVNLLPVNKKRSKSPGDSKEMLMARRRFLNAGYYRFLADNITALISANQASAEQNILDLGCGEGYYTHHLLKQCNPDFSKVCYFGTDIAKSAVQMAAKLNHSSEFCVASSADLPYVESIFDFVFNIFAPYSENEINRVLKPHGHFLMIGPGPDHLKELARYVYDEVKPHQGNPALDGEHASLRSRDKTSCREIQKVAREHIEPLLMMTPYYWSINEQNKARLLELDSLEITFEFTIELFQPCSSEGELN